MHIDHFAAAESARLRFVFGSSVELHDIAERTTYSDIARMFDEATRLRHGIPIAIDVKLAHDLSPALRREASGTDPRGR